MKAVLILILLGLVASQCDKKQTACKTSSGGIGCCPYEKAECCSDMQHCCPNGFACDISRGQCTRKSGNDFLAIVGLMERVKPVDSTADVLKCIKDIIPVIKDGLRIYADVKGAKVFDIASAIKAFVNDEKLAMTDCTAIFKNISTVELRARLEEAGIYQYQAIGDIIKCVEDVVPLIKDVKHIVEDIEGKKYDDLVPTIIRIVGEAQAAYADCSKVSSIETEKEEIYTDMIQCVKDLIPLVADGKKIYEDIKNKKTAEVLGDLMRIISEGEKAYADCTASYVSEVQDVQDILKCVNDLIPVVEDGMEIYNAVKAKQLPEIVKDLTKLIQDGKTAYADCTKAFTKQELNGTADVLQCIKDLVPVVKDAEVVYHDVEAKAYDNILQDLIKLVQDGKTAYADCTKAFEKEELTGAADVLKCIKDLIPVVQDGEKIYNDAKAKDVTHIIEDLKQLIADGNVAYKDCVGAFKSEVEVKGSPADIFQCIKDLAPLVKDAEKFAEDVKNKDYKDIVADLLQAVKDGEVAYTDCLKAFGQ